MRIHYAVLIGFLIMVGCGDEPSTPGDVDMAVVAGDYGISGQYGSSEFTTAEDGDTIDWVARGATAEITLAEDGTTTGRLFVPGGDEDGSDLDQDLTGTWTLDDGIVTFSHDADTFIRDTPFEVADDRLIGEETFSQTTVRLVFVRR